MPRPDFLPTLATFENKKKLENINFSAVAKG